MMPLIHDQDTDVVEETFAETLPCGWQALKNDHRRIWCIRTPTWKLIFNDFAPQERSTCELYDLEKDPGEQENVFGQNARIAEQLKKKLLVWMATEKVQI